MKIYMKTSALALTGALLIACGNKEQKNEANVNENPVEEKIEVKAVEGRKNFSDKAIITPLPAIMIATWDEKQNPDVMMVAWGGQCGPKHITFELSKHKTTDNIPKLLRPDGVYLPADSRNGLLRPTAHTTGVPALRPDGR